MHIRKTLLTMVVLSWSMLSANAAEVVLKAGVFVPPSTTYGIPFQIFADRVNEKGKGLIQIRVVGGPEAIPAAEQAHALENGVLDIAVLPPSYYKGQMVEADTQTLTEQSVAEQRASGAFAALNAIAEVKLNAHYLTSYGGGVPFHIFLTKEIASLDDLRGMNLRTQTTYSLIFQKLGIVGASIAAPEIFTALERGVVDGYGWPVWGIQDFGWDKMTKMRIDPGFYNVTINVLINNERFKALSDEQRDVLVDAAAWFEVEQIEWTKEITRQNLAFQEEAGIKVLDVGPELKELATQIYWEDLMSLSPEIPRLRELLLK